MVEVVRNSSKYRRVDQETVRRRATALSDLKEARQRREQRTKDGLCYIVNQLVRVGGGNHEEEKGEHQCMLKTTTDHFVYILS